MAATFNFPAFPPELRLMVYRALFDHDEAEQHYPHSMLQLSRQIRDECIPILLPQLVLRLEHDVRPDKYDSDPPNLPSFCSLSNDWTFPEDNQWGPSWFEVKNSPSLLGLMPYFTRVEFWACGCQCNSTYEVTYRVYINSNKASRADKFYFCGHIPDDDIQESYKKDVEKLISPSDVCSKELLQGLIDIAQVQKDL